MRYKEINIKYSVRTHWKDMMTTEKLILRHRIHQSTHRELEIQCSKAAAMFQMLTTINSIPIKRKNEQIFWVTVILVTSLCW